MIPVTASTPIMLAVEPVDFRRQMDGLIAHCRQALSINPVTGTFFVFINRARTMIRVLVYDGNGFWLMTKRLSKGKFTGWPTSGTALSALSAKALMQLLQTQRAQPVAVGCAEAKPNTNNVL
jgi:transposase